MNLIEQVHDRHVIGRRVRVLGRHFAELLPRDATVLDVGCGDGLLAQLIAAARPDLTLHGIDIQVRPQAAIPVTAFDGRTIPREDSSCDAVMMADVLHHTDDPLVLLREARRVARSCIVLKDHLREGILAGATLRFMDQVGNRRHAVPLPCNYWTRAQWTAAFPALGLTIDAWREALGLYPWPANLVFGRSLHFMARLTCR